MSYKECTEELKVPKKTLRDHKSKSSFEIDNAERKRFSVTRVDGCYITGNVEKCDYMVSVPNGRSGVVHLVELKGKKVDKAISQLESTLEKLPEHLNCYAKECYAVTTAFPKGRPDNMKKKKDFRKKNRANLNIKNMKYKIFI